MICILQLIDQFLLRSRAVLATTSDDYIYIHIYIYIHTGSVGGQAADSQERGSLRLAPTSSDRV